MISVKQLLENTKRNVHLCYVHASSGNAIHHDTARNLRHVVTQRGEKYIAVPNEELKDSIKTIIPHHDHKMIIAPTIFDAMDTIHQKGFPEVIIHTEPSKAKELEDAVMRTHGKKFKSISIKHLPSDFSTAKTTQDVDPSFKRRDAQKLLKKEDFELGQFVKTSLYEGEVVKIGPNYLTIVSEGNEIKVWKNDSKIIDKELTRNQIYKESFIYKSYKTKNFSRQLAEEFRDISKDVKDEYAFLSCIKCCDYLMSVDEEKVISKFDEVKMNLDRSKKYVNKFLINNILEQIRFVEENCLRYAILEGFNFSTTDKIAIARVLASVAEIPFEGNDPTAIVNKSLIKLRLLQLTPQGWELVGRLLKVASKAGIHWAKSSFSRSQLEMMKIE